MKKWISRHWAWPVMMVATYLFGSWMVGHDHHKKYIWADAEGYYMYLPAVVMYGGDFSQIPVRTKVQFKPYPGTDKVFTKYNYGVAVLEAPFFLGAYVSRIIQGFDPHVYAATDYSVALLLSACFYGTLGLFFIWKMLLRHFPDRRWVGAMTIATLWLGTNLLHYMAWAPGMSHAYSFFLVALLFYRTPGLYSSPSFQRRVLWTGKYVGAGLIAGLIVLIRPTNIIVLIFPLLYGVESWQGLTSRFDFLQKNWGKVLAAAAVAAMLWLPQMWYWHYLSGHWFIDPYSTESFAFWDGPLVHYVLFSYLNGYFIYNPVMLFPVLALFFLLRKNRLNSAASLLIFVIATYTFASWWCWWFAGAYGHRAYVELIPALALPLAFVFSKILDMKHKWLKISFLSLVGLLVFYNFRMVTLYEASWNDMTFNWEKYWKVFERVFFL